MYYVHEAAISLSFSFSPQKLEKPPLGTLSPSVKKKSHVRLCSETAVSQQHPKIHFASITFANLNFWLHVSEEEEAHDPYPLRQSRRPPYPWLSTKKMYIYLPGEVTISPSFFSCFLVSILLVEVHKKPRRLPADENKIERASDFLPELTGPPPTPWFSQ